MYSEVISLIEIVLKSGLYKRLVNIERSYKLSSHCVI